MLHVIFSAKQGAFKLVLSSRDGAAISTELQRGNPNTLITYMSFYGTNDTKKAVLEECKAFSLHSDWLKDTTEVREYLNSQLNHLAN